MNDSSGAVIDMEAFLARVRARQAARGTPISDEERARMEREDRMHDPNSPEGRAHRRRQRLRWAGVQSADTVDLVADAEEAPIPEGGSRAMRAVVGWLSTPHARSLALLGGVGVGKSTAMAWALASLPDGLLLRAPSVVPSEAWDDLHARARKCRILCIDDPRAGERETWRLGQLADLLTARHDDQLRTIISANWVATEADVRASKLAPGSSIEGALGDAALSRLCERHGDRVLGGIVVCGGVDLRRRG
jgi:hypothetical protein